MSESNTKIEAPKPQLTLLDSICIIAGTIIGAGIYESTPEIARQVGGSPQLILAFLIGGVVALLGALCYAELATTYPNEGGEYVYLCRAYGNGMGTLFVWFQFWIVRPANVGAVAYVLARYGNQLIPWGLFQEMIQPGGEVMKTIAGHQLTSIALACGGISLVTALNLFGIRVGKWTQNVLTFVKIATLLSIFIVALFAVPSTTELPAPENPPTSNQVNWVVALVLVMFAFGGWNDLSYVAAEIHNPRKNLLRALIGGTGIVTIAYVLYCVALVQRMGYEHIVDPNVTLSFLKLYVGSWATLAMSFAVAISCLGALHAMVFTGARIFYALGANNRLFDWLGQWDAERGVPQRALLMQFVVTIALVVTLGWKENGFFRLVIFSGPFFFFFFFLTACSVIVLRWRDPDAERPYRVHLYPVTPLLFVTFCAGMFYSALTFLLGRWSADFFFPTIWAAVVTVAGLFVAFKSRQSDKA